MRLVAKPSGSRLALRSALLVAGVTAAASPVLGLGSDVFPVSLTNTVTGEKPQSKLWYHDGFYWAVLRGPEGVAIYQKTGDAWRRGAFADAILAPSGQADVKWNGSHLLVLLYASTTKLFEYSYDSANRAWVLQPGFPVSAPRPSGAETMVLEQDSTGRLWITAEGGTNINVYFTTGPDHRQWSSTPVVLQRGVDSDDITSIVAFGGDKVGIFWSDQVRDEFGFRVHHDADAPTAWDAEEVVSSGLHVADDHIHLSCDAGGRVYALTKDDFDHMAVHRRGPGGDWTTRTDVIEGLGTRGIIQVSDQDAKVYILYTRWGSPPDRIEYRSASLEDLHFGESVPFITTAGNLNNVTGMKQPLPQGSLIAMAEGSGRVWWNGWGSPPPPASLPSIPPAAPAGLMATWLDSPAQVELAWSPSPSGAPEGYNVYRQEENGESDKLNATPVAIPRFTDTHPDSEAACYRVTAVAHGLESATSDAACAARVSSTLEPPAAPLALVASSATASRTAPPSGVAAYTFDEGVGQATSDATGHGHTGQLGSSPTYDTADPAWVPGLGGSALWLDGSNDRVRVADAPDLHLAGSFTLEAWIQRAPSTATHCVLSKGDAGKRNFWMVIDGSNRVDFRWQSAGGTDHGTTSTATIPDGAGHHVACVYDQAAGEDRIYIDGALVKQAPDTGTPATSGDPLYIGARLSAGSLKNFYKGAIDLVRVSAGPVYRAGFSAPASFASMQDFAIVQLEWTPPATGAPVGYHIYRNSAGGDFVRLDTDLVTSSRFTDGQPLVGASCYRVTAMDAAWQEGPASDPACMSSPAPKTSGWEPVAPPDAVPLAGLELGASPNPFNPATTIRFRLAEARPVNLTVYDVRGERVATLLDGPQAAGEHAVPWLGRNLAGARATSGVYFLVLRAGDLEARQKLILVQ